MMNFIIKNKSVLERVGAALFAILIWQAASMLINKSVLLASPVEVIQKLAEIVVTADFWQRVLFTLIRISVGFAAAFCVGSAAAVLAGRFHIVEVLMHPFAVTVKSVPVASFIVLLFIFFSSENISASVSFLMVFPVIYTGILQGVKHKDQKLEEMAKVFGMSWYKRFLYIRLEQVKPFLLSSVSVSLGLAWKAGTAAEVIAIPQGSIGEMLYEAKIYLLSDELLAWTAVIVLISVGLEKAVTALIGLAYKRFERS